MKEYRKIKRSFKKEYIKNIQFYMSQYKKLKLSVPEIHIIAKCLKYGRYSYINNCRKEKLSIIFDTRYYKRSRNEILEGD